jgi:aromatic ring-opening dioxygenase LigB subunit
MCNRTLATRSGDVESLARIKKKGVGQARANKRIESITKARILNGEAKKSYVNKYADVQQKYGTDWTVIFTCGK